MLTSRGMPVSRAVGNLEHMPLGVLDIAVRQRSKLSNFAHFRAARHNRITGCFNVFGIENDLVRIHGTSGRGVDAAFGSMRLVESEPATAGVELNPIGVFTWQSGEAESVAIKVGTLVYISHEDDDAIQRCTQRDLLREAGIAKP